LNSVTKNSNSRHAYQGRIVMHDLCVLTVVSFLLIYRSLDSKKNQIPVTEVKEEGSARRNIDRKTNHDPNRKEKKQHGGAGGKGKWNEIDDGTDC